MLPFNSKAMSLMITKLILRDDSRHPMTSSIRYDGLLPPGPLVRYLQPTQAGSELQDPLIPGFHILQYQPLDQEIHRPKKKGKMAASSQANSPKIPDNVPIYVAYLVETYSRILVPFVGTDYFASSYKPCCCT